MIASVYCSTFGGVNVKVFYLLLYSIALRTLLLSTFDIQKICINIRVPEYIANWLIVIFVIYNLVSTPHVWTCSVTAIFNVCQAWISHDPKPHFATPNPFLRAQNLVWFWTPGHSPTHLIWAPFITLFFQFNNFWTPFCFF